MPILSYSTNLWYGSAAAASTEIAIGALNADVIGDAKPAATVSGVGSVVDSDITRLVNSPMTVAAVGEFADASMRARATPMLTVSIGARPSAFDIAQAVWGSDAASLNLAGTMGNKINNAMTTGKFLALK